MAFQPGVWGIDIGQCALKAVRLQLVDGVVTATAFDYVEHPKILSQPDANPDDLTREALDKFLSRNPIKGDRVAIGVPGQSGLARFVKLPPVEEKKIDDIVKFEAKQQIPFPLEEVVWDYQKVSEGIVEGGFAIDTEIGLFAMKRDMINRFLNHFQNVKVEVHVIQMTPLALCNYITYDMLNKGNPADAPPGEAPAPVGGKKKCIVALDIGTDGSNLIITDGGKIIWQRPIPIGGNHFTRALTKELKLTFAKAEHLKRNAAKSPELAAILKALKPVLTDFVGEVQRSLGYFTNTHRDAQVEYMVGLGSAFKLPGLQKYLGDKLQLRIEKPARFNKLAGESVTNAPVFMENLLTFPVAFGLALQGLGAARLGTNLLPPEITWDRQIRAKKPWAVAAAAMLMIGTGVLAYGYSVPYAAVNDPKIADAINKGNEAKKQAGAVDNEISGRKAEVATGLESVQAILAGKDERKNWLAVNEFINMCLPIPGPDGNLKGTVQIDGQPFNLETLWNRIDGENGGPLGATNKYRERLRKGVDPKNVATDDDLRQYLAAVDVEAIHCRFTTNLEGFFQNAKQYCLKYVGPKDAVFMGMDPAEREPMMADPPVYPKGKDWEKAWVFEIRGTTWYELESIQGPELLRKTLLRNLQELGKKSTQPEIKDRVSHVFLYNTWRDDLPRPDTYQKISDSLIDVLMPADATEGSTATGSTGTATTGAMPPPMASGPGQGPAGVSTWRPISKGTASRGPGKGGPGGVPPFGGMNQGGGGNPYQESSSVGNGKDGKGGMRYPMGPGPGIPGKTEQPERPKTKSKPRYEFVIVFVWREPTPSDRFMPKSPAAGTTASTTATGTMPGSAVPPPAVGVKKLPN